MSLFAPIRGLFSLFTAPTEGPTRARGEGTRAGEEPKDVAAHARLPCPRGAPHHLQWAEIGDEAADERLGYDFGGQFPKGVRVGECNCLLMNSIKVLLSVLASGLAGR